MPGRVRSLAGCIVAAVALWLAFADVHVSGLVTALALADPIWLAAAFFSVFLTLALVVLRTRLLLSSWAAAPSWVTLWHVTILGQVANILIPFRLGDGAKVLAGTRSLSQPVAVMATVVALERVLDAFIFGVAMVALLLYGAAPGWTRTWLLATAALGLTVGFAGLALVKMMSGSSPVSSSASRRGLRGVITRQAALVREGLRQVGSPAAVIPLVFGSGAILLASAFTNFLAFRALHLPVPAWAALLLLVVSQSGNAVAATPGGIGVSQFIAVKTLALWGVSPPDSLACSLALFAVSRAPKMAMLPMALLSIARLRSAAVAPVKV